MKDRIRTKQPDPVVYQALKSHLDAIPKTSPLFQKRDRVQGEINFQCMPREGNDQRCSSWCNLVENWASNAEEVANEDDCFISTYKGLQYDYPTCQFGKDTHQQATPVYLVAYVLAHPNQWRSVASFKAPEKSAPNANCITHLCRNIKCFNPKHLVLTNMAEHKSHQLCKYGCAATCPHDPKCIWTDDEGKRFPCLNDENGYNPGACTHNPACKHKTDQQ
jgi:hypothetical protein